MLQKVFQLNRGQKIRYNCFFSKPNSALTPEKHIYMTHNFQNMYDEPVPFGSFPSIIIKTQIESQFYLSQIQKITLDHLKEVYPKFNLNVDVTLKHEDMYATWKKLNVADFENEKEVILQKLASGIIVKESKLTWIKEQRERLTTTLMSFQGGYNHPYEFFDFYNQVIWSQVRQSHLWSSPDVEGHAGLLVEKLIDDISARPVIESLSASTKENNTSINRFMRFVHS